MSGTKAGAAQAQETRLEKYGVDKYGKSIQQQLAGRQGGLAVTDKLKGFAARPELASSAGRRGGKKSRRKTLH